MLTLDVVGDQAWIGVRHARQAGAATYVKISSGETLADFRVGLPAAVVIAGDRASVTDYDDNRLLGFRRPS